MGALVIDGIHWFSRFECWSGFSEAVHLVHSPSGCYYASDATGKMVHAIYETGYTHPAKCDWWYSGWKLVRRPGLKRQTRLREKANA